MEHGDARSMCSGHFSRIRSTAFLLDIALCAHHRTASGNTVERAL